MTAIESLKRVLRNAGQLCELAGNSTAARRLVTVPVRELNGYSCAIRALHAAETGAAVAWATRPASVVAADAICAVTLSRAMFLVRRRDPGPEAARLLQAAEDYVGALVRRHNQRPWGDLMGVADDRDDTDQ